MRNRYNFYAFKGAFLKLTIFIALRVEICSTSAPHIRDWSPLFPTARRLAVRTPLIKFIVKRFIMYRSAHAKFNAAEIESNECWYTRAEHWKKNEIKIGEHGAEIICVMRKYNTILFSARPVCARVFCFFSSVSFAIFHSTGLHFVVAIFPFAVLFSPFPLQLRQRNVDDVIGAMSV